MRSGKRSPVAREYRRGCSMLAVVAVLVCLSAVPAAMAEREAPAASAAPESPGSPERSALEFIYEVEIHGVEDELLETLRSVSQLITRESRPPATLRGLRRRLDSDKSSFEKAVRARGYYGSTITSTLNGIESPIIIRIHVDLGPVYELAAFHIKGVPEVAGDFSSKEALERLGVKLGAPALADTVVTAEDLLVLELVSASFPFAHVHERRVLVDHEPREMRVSLVVDAGQQARFGDITVIGLSEVKEKYVRRRVLLPRGEPYDPEAIERSRRELLEGGAFSSVRITHASGLDEEGLLPITISVTEKKPQTLGAGLKYSSSEGLGVRAYWEHRNALGGAERLRVSSRLSEILTATTIEYREPDFLQPRQYLLSELFLGTEDTEAFFSRSVRLSAILERRLGESLVGGAGISFEQSNVEEDAKDDHFTLVGFPLTLRYDSTDDIFDPSLGHRAALTVTPYADAVGTDLGMLVSRLSESLYFNVLDEKRLILAARCTVGSIIGPSRGDVPANKRFYAGGGNSVRGYDYQLVGDLEQPVKPNDPDPLGGRGLFQFGVEVRVRVTETIGVVPFLEAASVHEDSIPRPDKDLFWGAGLGFRYYTPIGPIRLDVAVPLDRRSGVDDSFELYLSLGQAF